jgi:hypothetical protein
MRNRMNIHPGIHVIPISIYRIHKHSHYLNIIETTLHDLRVTSLDSHLVDDEVLVCIHIEATPIPHDLRNLLYYCDWSDGTTYVLLYDYLEFAVLGGEGVDQLLQGAGQEFLVYYMTILLFIHYFN